MRHRTRPPRPSPLLVALAVTIAGFFGADVVTSVYLHRLARPLHDVSINAEPSVTHLGRALAGLVALGRDGHVALDSGRPLPQLAADVAVVDDEVSAYLESPNYPGEPELWSASREDLDAVRRDVASMAAALERGELAAARSAYDSGVLPHATYAADRLSELLSLNAEGGAASARAAAAAGERVRALGYALDGANVAVAVLFAAVAARAHRRYEEAVESRTRELEAFSGRVAHDLRGPLTPAVFALDRLSSSADLPAPLRTAVDRGRRGLGRTLALVDALLDFARAGGRPDVAARADVRQVLAEVVEESAAVADAARVSVTLAAERAPGAVACAPGVLASIASNLVRNAVKHMGDSRERRVEVRAVAHGRAARVEVADTGPGVPLGMERAVFEPYVRASHAAGLGLGLATVKRLVEAHGGAVGVASSPSGATFWFELPAAESPRSSA